MTAEIFAPDSIALILVVAALVFGSKRLPEMARALGRAKGELQRGLREGDELDGSALTTPPPGDEPPPS
jgi:sec-independent protein translocase protein TatA